MFLIPIRNKSTGEEKNFFGPQEIADFLAGRGDAAEWTGWEFIGELPKASEPVEESAPAEAPEAELAEPVAADETLIEKVEHAIEDVIHEVLPSAAE